MATSGLDPVMRDSDSFEFFEYSQWNLKHKNANILVNDHNAVRFLNLLTVCSLKNNIKFATHTSGNFRFVNNTRRRRF